MIDAFQEGKNEEIEVAGTTSWMGQKEWCDLDWLGRFSMSSRSTAQPLKLQVNQSRAAKEFAKKYPRIASQLTSQRELKVWGLKGVFSLELWYQTLGLFFHSEMFKIQILIRLWSSSWPKTASSQHATLLKLCLVCHVSSTSPHWWQSRP